MQLDEEGGKAWGPIRSTVGVSHLVKFGSKFARVGQELVRLVQEHTKTNTIDERYKEGDAVLVADGPFRGIEAIFKAYDGEKRTVLLLSILTKVTEAKFGLGQIIKAA